MNMDIQAYQEEFNQRRGIHFNSAGITPVPSVTATVIEHAVNRMQEGTSLHDADLLAETRNARVTLARFLGTDPSRVGWTPNCATALSIAALGFPLQPGDRVLTLDQEYSSNYYPWKVACERSGATLVSLPHDENCTVDESRLLEAIVPGVRIVAVSWVQFQTGAIIDLVRLGERCHEQGAFLVVDAIQGLGQLPFQFDSVPVDFVAGGSHKWLCSINGQGFFAAKPDFMRELRPIAVGGGTFNRFGTFADPVAEMESSARRFEPGGYGFVPVLALGASVSLIESVGVGAIEGRIRELSDRLRSGILASGFDLVTPAEQRGGITSLRLMPSQETPFLRRCGEERIALVKRGSFIRISPHAFCSENEVDRILDLLKETRP
jgi:selenocysteine lyase/cysteine desulfurase